MDSLIIILIVMLLSSGVLLFLWPHKRKPAGAGKKKEKPRGVPDSASVKDGLLSLKHGFEEELKRLRAELEKTNDDYQLLHDEMEKELNVKRRQEEEFKKEIQRLKGWGDKEKSELDKLRKENNSLQSRFLQTQKDAEKEFSSNLALRRELQEKEKHIQDISRRNKELCEKLRDTENRETVLKKVSAEQGKALSEQRRRAAESEWISKEEYTRVLVLLEEKNGELDRLKAGRE